MIYLQMHCSFSTKFSYELNKMGWKLYMFPLLKEEVKLTTTAFVKTRNTGKTPDYF